MLAEHNRNNMLAMKIVISDVHIFQVRLIRCFSLFCFVLECFSCHIKVKTIVNYDTTFLRQIRKLLINLLRIRQKKCGRMTEKTPSITHRCFYLDLSSPGSRCFSPEISRCVDAESGWTRKRVSPRPGRSPPTYPPCCPCQTIFCPRCQKNSADHQFFPRRSAIPPRGPWIGGRRGLRGVNERRSQQG